MSDNLRDPAAPHEIEGVEFLPACDICMQDVGRNATDDGWEHLGPFPPVIGNLTMTRSVTFDPDDPAVLETVRDALDRHQYAQFNEAARAIGSKGFDYEALSESTRRIRYNQTIDAARAVISVLKAGGT